MTATMTSRDFNQDVSRAKRLADDAPVTITDRGQPAYVLMTHDEFLRLTGNTPSILDLLADSKGDEIEFEPRRLKGGRIRKVDFD
jgi:Antitoxin Phd_YefM, type II toxin-antitoxin system